MTGIFGHAIDGGAALVSRREHILNAAEACFVRNGFHRATMQDVAREADMSPGNIYRYFDSKEALVVGLGERAYSHATILHGRLCKAGDRRAELLGIMREYFFGTSREDAILRVDLWSEATRNPAIADLIERGDRDFRAWFVDASSSLATSPEFDAEALLATVDALLKGVIVNRALLAECDPAPAIAQLHAILDAGLAGRLPSQTAASEACR